MDTVTHALLGAAISDSWFRKRLGPVATPFALVVTAAPDLDVVAFLVSPEYGWLHHRGYTHAFFTIALASPILGLIGCLLGKRAAAWSLWTLLAFLCLLSHTLTDLATSWGTMALLPFSDARMSWDLIPIIDVFLFSTLMASFVANRILRWERIDTFLNPLAYPVVHRHPNRQRAADRFATVVMILFVAYMGLSVHQNRQMVRKARAALAADGFEAVEVRAVPYMLTYISGNLVARDAAGNIRTGFYSSLAPEKLRFASHPARDDKPAHAALASRWGRLFNWYAQGMVEARERRAAGSGEGDGERNGEERGGMEVQLIDRRFNTVVNPDVSRFNMEVEVNADGYATSGRAAARNPALDDIKDEMRLLWRLTRYGETTE